MDTQNISRPGEKIKGTELHEIMPFLWFDHEAEEAANFYTSIFENARIKSVIRYNADGAKVAGQQQGKVMTVSFQLEGQAFAVINGGPIYKITPVISFFVNCSTPQEIDRLWEKLSDGGTVMMKLDKYPFSEKYGWIQDKFGVSWQLILLERKQKITPCFMFAGEQHKKAEEAINFYVSVFKDSQIIQLEHYEAGVGPEGGVVHGRFSLNGQEFTAMDSHMQLPYDFNPAISFVVNCKTQEEVDYYWEALSKGGDEMAQQCGWLKDRFGISWQIIPNQMLEMLSDPDPNKSGKVMQAMLQMKKIDLNVLKKAYQAD